ncbi:MAG: alkaline phosphatase [Bacteroidaceae bacterium]|nr:alkaline phosphatase [Bacteroidaceae bacterium]
MKNRFFSTLILLMMVLAVSAAKKPKYIFYFIGDGMGLSPVLVAETYNQTVLGNKEKPLLMLQFPVASVATSYSASHTITDSAAGGTALATGHKTKNGMLGVDADTVPVKSIAYELKEKGYGIAIATSVAPDDATPGAFYTNVDHRNKFYDITKDMAESDFDMFAGGKLRGTAPKGEPDVRTVLTNAGYSIVDGPAQWNEQKHGDKVVLLNQPYHLTHIGYTIDSIQGNLTLPFITQACLDHLEKVSPKKFFMMIEGGLIDHALHPNDGGAAIKELLNFDESLRLAYDFYLRHKDETLIIVTADHNTGGMVAGVNGGSYNLALKNFDYQRISMQAMQHECQQLTKSGKQITWEYMKEYLKEKLGLYSAIPVSKSNDRALQEAFKATFIDKNGAQKETLYVNLDQFVIRTFQIIDKITGIGWTTGSHTADFVPVYAIGVGSELFQGFQDNTEIPNKIRRICGIKEHASK